MSIVMRPLLPDPTDIVVQGEMTVFMNMPVAMLNPVLQGEVTVASMPGFPVPIAMVGQHEWYGLLPRKLAPMRVAGGEIVFVDVGDPTAPVAVEPTTGWLNQNLGKQVGGYSDLGPDIIGPAEATNCLVITADDPLDDTERIMLPRRALALSNLSGKRYFPRLPESYFQREMVNGTMVQATQRYAISGQTLNSTGAPLGNCRVVMLDSSRVIAGGAINPVVDETISDGSGNYTITAPRPVEYQLMAYLPGSPDVAGITRDDVFPAVV